MKTTKGFVHIVAVIAISLVAVLMLTVAVVSEQGRGGDGAGVVNMAVNQNTNSNVNSEVTIVDTSDWLTYENEDYGFSIQYPRACEYRESTDSGGLVLVTWGGCDFDIFIDARNGASIKKWMSDRNYQKTEVYTSGEDSFTLATFTGEMAGTSRLALINNDQYMFRIDLKQGSVIDLKSIIDGFSFTPDTPDWLTYENEEYGYSLKYPADWSAETVESDMVMDRVIGDAILSNGECQHTCNLSSGFCEFGISKVNPLVQGEINNPVQWIKEQGFYKGDEISGATYNGFESFITKVAVTPSAEDGSQGMGKYILINDGHGNYYSTALSKGFALEECATRMGEIIKTLQFP